MIYERFDCLWAGKGPIPDAMLQQVLAPYTVIEPPRDWAEEWRLRVALVTPRPFRVAVFQQEADAAKAYTGVYLANASIDDAGLEECRADGTRYLVDFAGDILIAPPAQVWAEQDRFLARTEGPAAISPRQADREFIKSLIGIGKELLLEGRFFLARPRVVGEAIRDARPQAVWDNRPHDCHADMMGSPTDAELAKELRQQDPGRWRRMTAKKRWQLIRESRAQWLRRAAQFGT